MGPIYSLGLFDTIAEVTENISGLSLSHTHTLTLLSLFSKDLPFLVKQFLQLTLKTENNSLNMGWGYQQLNI